MWRVLYQLIKSTISLCIQDKPPCEAHSTLIKMVIIIVGLGPLREYFMFLQSTICISSELKLSYYPVMGGRMASVVNAGLT
jgi:hypothetical protein